MKVTRKSNKKVAICDVKIGQTFIEDNEFFLMCRYEGDNICCPYCDESIDIYDEINYLAVMLSSGEIYNFESYNEVTLVECEVVEI